MEEQTKVVIILGVILGTVGGMKLAASHMQDKSVPPDIATPARVANVATTVDHYHFKMSRLPATLDAAIALQGFEIETRDGWGRHMRYRANDPEGETGYTVCSAGPDGWFDTEDDVCVGQMPEQ